MMWLVQGEIDRVKWELKVKERSFIQESVEIFESDYFGKILVRDDEALYCEHDSAMRHEVMAHTAMCTHAEPQKVLVIDGGDGALVHELCKHKGVIIDVIESDGVMIPAMEAFGRYLSAFEEDQVSLEVCDALEFLVDCEEKSYDIIFFNRFDLLYLDDASVMAQIDRVLSEKGLVVMEASSQLFDIAGHKKVLSALSPFKIVMPFWYTSMVKTGGERWLAMGSKFFHPTADINLQRADLTDGLIYYNADVHLARFALPTATFELLKESIKR